MSKLIIGFVILLLLNFFASAYACQGPFAEVQTFLPRLPDNATSKEIVGKVQILATEVVTLPKKELKRLSKVTVIEAFKGVKKNDIFNVESEIHSCARDADIMVGSQFFISGSMNKSGNFEGVWKALPSDPYAFELRKK